MSNLNHKFLNSFFFLLATFCASSALNIDDAKAYPILGTTYEAHGNAPIFDNNKRVVSSSLLAGSNFRFDADGIFRLNLVTALGTSSVELGFDVNKFGKGDIALKPATPQYVQRVKDHLNSNSRTQTYAYRHTTDVNMDGINSPIDALLLINDLNANQTSQVYKQIGTFNPFVTGYGPYTFISSKMDGLFRANGSFTIWNTQLSSAGVNLGSTDWWLTSGKPITQVPEPFSLALLGSGIVGLATRRKVRAPK